MATPFNPKRYGDSRKLIYCTRNAKLVPVAKEFPGNLEDVSFADKVVLQAEHYIHDEWHPIRTSLVLSETFNEGTVDIETRNSIYQVVDGSITAIDVITARIEALFETTFIKGGHVHMPDFEPLSELFTSHEVYGRMEHDDRLVNMLKDIEHERGDYTTDYSIRLLYRQPLRRFLQLLVENGGETQCNLSFERS